MALFHGKIKRVFEGEGSFSGHTSIVWTSDMDFGRTRQLWISKDEALQPETLKVLAAMEKGSVPKEIKIKVETRKHTVIEIKIEGVLMVHRYARIAAADMEERRQRELRLMSLHAGRAKSFSPSLA